MPRAAPPSRTREIVAAARVLLEAVGVEAFTLRELAARVGMRAPSLYRHFADKRAIALALAVEGFESLATCLEQAPSTLSGLAQAYRGFALAHPELYGVMYDRTLSRDALPTQRAFAPLVAICDGSFVEARVAWAFAHGLTSLELSGRFPPGADLEAIWQDGLARLERRERKSR